MLAADPYVSTGPSRCDRPHDVDMCYPSVPLSEVCSLLRASA